MKLRYIDIHCHPFIDPLKKEQEAVIEQMAEEGVGGIVVGVDLATSKEAIALAEKYDHLWATVGLHPNDTPTESFDSTIYGGMAAHPKVVAIGECGIDYYRLQPTADSQQLEKQRQWENFEKQVELATKCDKPLMVHARPSKGTMDTHEEMLAWLEPRVQRLGARLRGNMHFFVGDLAVAKRFWDIGFTTSFTGVLTFTHDYDEVVKAAPLDMLMVETDAPFAAPAPHRGKTNYPTYLPLVVDAIARIRGEDTEVVREALLSNTRRIFALDG